MPALATYEQSVSPESVAKVPLTGLSFTHRTTAWRIRWSRIVRAAAEIAITAAISLIGCVPS